MRYLKRACKTTQNARPDMRRGAGVVERGGLENRCALAGTVGSNPTLSATCVVRNFSPPPQRQDFPVIFKGWAGGLFTFVSMKHRKSISPGRFSLNLMAAAI